MKNKNFESLVDANIATLSKVVEMSKKGKNLKAEFVRDDGGGGKYYGYMRGGKVHVIHSKDYASRGKWGGTTPYKQQLGAADESSSEPSSAPRASQDSAVDYGGAKVNAWREDAEKILGNAGDQVSKQGGSQSQGEREAGAIEAAGGGSYQADPQQLPVGSLGGVNKNETKLENIVARLAEAYAQYLKVKGGKDYDKAFQIASQAVQGLFKKQVLERIRQLTGHDIIYDITQNQFRYAKGMGGTTSLSERDQSVVDSVVAEFTQKSNKAIKAKQTSVRRAEGSPE